MRQKFQLSSFCAPGGYTSLIVTADRLSWNRNNKRKQNIKMPAKHKRNEKRRACLNVYDDLIAVVSWKDNKVVTMASNGYGINPVTRVNRVATVSHERRKILVKCLKVVNKYNSYKGGVDRFNQYVYSQRESFLGKKW